MQIRKKTIKNYITVIFGIGFNRGVAFLNTVLIARILGPSKFGEFAIFQIVMILTWEFAQAFDTTFIRYAKGSRSEKERAGFLKSTLLVKFIYISIAWLAAYPLSHFLAHKAFEKPEIFIHIFTAVFCGGFLAFLMTYASVYQSKEKFVMFSIINSSFSVLMFCAIIGSYFIQGELILEKLINLYLYVTGMLGIISLFILIKKNGNPLKIQKHLLAKIFKLSKWIFGVTVVFFIFQRIDTLFLTRIMKFDNLGVYFAATQIVMFVSLLSGPLGNVFLPMASTALESKDSLKLYIKESLAAACIVNVFVLILIAFAPLIMKIVFGSEYLSGCIVLRILLVGWLFWIFYQPFSYLFYTLEDSRSRFAIEVLKLVCGIILLIKLVPLFGIQGAAISIAGAFAFNAILSSIILWRKVSIKMNCLNELKPEYIQS